MKRIEIICNRAIEEDLFNIFKQKGITKFYTKIPVVHGIGSSGPRMGDHIWPEENFMLIIYCDEKEADLIRESIEELKQYFKDEGVKMFEIDVVCCV